MFYIEFRDEQGSTYFLNSKYIALGPFLGRKRLNIPLSEKWAS